MKLKIKELNLPKTMKINSEMNIKKFDFKIKRFDRENKLNQKSFAILFTGLSGAGKSTISNALEIELTKLGYTTYSLDGDNIRMGINKNLGFTEEDRTENLRRIGEVAKLFIDAGLIVMCSFIAPTAKDRQMIKDIVGERDYVEVYVKASVETCAERDPKGLYKKAYSGEIKNFTGVSAPYEVPKTPYHTINTEIDDVEKCVERLVKSLAIKIKAR
jgi:adenylylsulfate kinase